MSGLVAVAFCLYALWASAAFAGKADNSLVWAANKEVMALDPYFDTSREALVLSGHVYDGLVYWNPETDEYEPLLATKWTWIDNTTLEFDLRQGVVFHDGSSFGPEDVVYTINFMKNEESGVLNYGDTKWLKSAEQVDKDTVRIYLVEPFPAALANLALTLPVLPDKHFDAAPVKSDGKKAYAAVPANGTGPYRVTLFKQGERVEVAANPDYFTGGAKGKPSIEKLVYRTIADDGLPSGPVRLHRKCNGIRLRPSKGPGASGRGWLSERFRLRYLRLS
jgi:peptide/nickel transport system substrate-binding protein